MNADEFMRSNLSVALVFGIIPVIFLLVGGWSSLMGLLMFYGVFGFPVCLIVCAATAA